MRLHELRSAYYFSYGHLSRSEHLHDLAPDAELVGVGKLENFKLTFHRFANIERSHGNDVYGVVWKVRQRDFSVLDSHEALHKNYDRIPLEVKVDDRWITCMVYVMDPTNGLSGAPTEKYIQAMVKGYKEHDLPLDQIKRALKEF